MKKTLIILGVIFSLILIWVFSFFFSLYLDYNKSKKYVANVVESVIPEWDLAELKDRMHPEIIKAISPEEFINTFHFFEENFIRMESYGEIEGEVKKTEEGFIIGVFTVPLTFENTNAQLTITVQKIKDHWVVNDFRIKSKKMESESNDVKTSSI